VTVCITEKREVTANFHVGEDMVLNLGRFMFLGCAPKEYFSLLTDTCRGMPRADLSNPVSTGDQDRSVLVLNSVDTNLAFFIVPSGPNLPINEEQGVILTTGNHLNILATHANQFCWRRYPVKVS